MHGIHSPDTSIAWNPFAGFIFSPTYVHEPLAVSTAHRPGDDHERVPADECEDLEISRAGITDDVLFFYLGAHQTSPSSFVWIASDVTRVGLAILIFRGKLPSVGCVKRLQFR